MNKEELKAYFHQALFELQQGYTYEDLEEALPVFEAENNFEACEGIQRAIEFHKILEVMELDLRFNYESN